MIITFRPGPAMAVAVRLAIRRADPVFDAACAAPLASSAVTMPLFNARRISRLTTCFRHLHDGAVADGAADDAVPLRR